MITASRRGQDQRMPRPKRHHDPAAIEARLRAEPADTPVDQKWWPSVPEVAALFGRHRTVVWRWVKTTKTLRSRGGPGKGVTLAVHPEDVLALLDKSREIQGEPVAAKPDDHVKPPTPRREPS